MGADLGAEPVLERCDDPAAVGVVLGVRRRDQEQVQRQPQDVAANLDVALLQHVEQGDLDAFGEVGQLVDAEDAPVGARDQAVVDGLRVAEGTALRDLHRVDIADQVADARVRRGEFLAEPFRPVLPGDRCVVAELGEQQPASGTHRRVGMVVDLAAGDHRRPLVQQADQGADQTGLALSPLAEEDDVVTGQQRPFHLGEHRVVEADDAGEPVLAAGHSGKGVVPQLRAYGPMPVS